MWRRRPSTALSEWPLHLGGHTPQGEPVLLRPLGLADESDYFALRRANAEWLAPWDATSPVPRAPRTFSDVLDS